MVRKRTGTIATPGNANATIREERSIAVVAILIVGWQHSQCRGSRLQTRCSFSDGNPGRRREVGEVLVQTDWIRGSRRWSPSPKELGVKKTSDKRDELLFFLQRIFWLQFVRLSVC